MRLKVIRKWKKGTYTIGQLLVDGAFFCNTLEVGEDGMITGFALRTPQSKLRTAKALQTIGFETIAAGDSYNDLGRIRAGSAGFLFRSTPQIMADNPDLPAFETYDELLAAITEALDAPSVRGEE